MTDRGAPCIAPGGSAAVPCHAMFIKKWIKQSLCVAETNNVSLQAKLFVAGATEEQRIL